MGRIWALSAVLGLVGIAPVSLGMAAAMAEQTAAEMPATKPGTLIIEGSPEPTTLELYSQPEIPLVTYYPDMLFTETTCSSEGCGIFFYPEGGYRAEVHYFFPVGDASPADIEQGLTGPGSYLASHGWVVSGEYSDPDYLNYPWAQKVILFQGAGEPVTGAVYIGEAEGVAFRVTVMFDLDAGDGFAPLAASILENTQVVAPEPASPTP